MFSKLLLIAVFLNCLFISNVACEVEDDNLHQRDLRDSSSFFTKIYKFFKDFATSEEVQAGKKRVISAFFGNRKKTRKPDKSLNIQKHKLLSVNNYHSFIATTIKRDKRPETDAEQMIITHGYKAESHTVLTADGYMITMQRVVCNFDVSHDRVVILHHGLFGSSEDWLLLGEKKALPYLLTENGFDVWLLNARGNRYSRLHTRKNADMMNFWDFSWHEMGVYDLPAAIQYITEVTKKAELNFIGHSMGATALLVLLSTLPEYNYLLRSGILLAPLAFMYHAKGPIRTLANFYRVNGHHSLNFLGQTEFMENETFPEQIVEKYCKGDNYTCANPLLLLAEGGKKSLSPKLMRNVLAHSPAGGSVKTLMHYVQLVKNGYFQMFDNGATDNFRKYKNSTPFFYDLSQVTLPIALFSSPSDWLATVSDIETLLPLLQYVSIHHVIKVEDFGHLDFVWSQDAPELIFNFILSILDKIVPKRDSFVHN